MTNATRSFSDRFGVIFSLFALYIIWGSTYLAIRFAVKSVPPFVAIGGRYMVAGLVLLLLLRLRGVEMPTSRQWAGSAMVGGLLLLGGNGLVAFAEQKVASGLAATMIATVPLWAAIFSGLWGRWPNRRESIGLAIGFAGVGILNLGGNLRANPWDAAILIVAAASWAFGSIWSRRLPLPSGLMASAAEMLMGGVMLALMAIITGERIPSHVLWSSLAAILYLVVFGSLVAYSAYNYLLSHVRPALATSYAYVNPAVAVGLGIVLAGEQVSGKELLALAVILCGVALVIQGRERQAGSRTPAEAGERRKPAR